MLEGVEAWTGPVEEGPEEGSDVVDEGVWAVGDGEEKELGSNVEVRDDNGGGGATMPVEEPVGEAVDESTDESVDVGASDADEVLLSNIPLGTSISK